LSVIDPANRGLEQPLCGDLSPTFALLQLKQRPEERLHSNEGAACSSPPQERAPPDDVEMEIAPPETEFVPGAGLGHVTPLSKKNRERRTGVWGVNLNLMSNGRQRNGIRIS
jgi:hypothetical protein